MFAKLTPGRSLPAASGPAGLVLSALFGLLFVMILTPHGFLAGVSGYWQTQVEDIGQYQSGFTAYMRAPWSLPLLSIPSLNWPTGTVVTFVDAIPAMAIVWKFLDLVLPMPENPFGYWLGFCYIMQGVATWYVMRQIRRDDWLALGLAVVLCVWMPSLAARMGHLSLQAHFIPLFALGLYFRTQRENAAQVGRWTLLLVVAFYMNFYLTAMAMAIMFAASLDLHWRTGQRKVLFLHAIPVIAIIATVPLMLGTSFGKAVPDTGFGYYSMNLLSPVAYGNLLKMPFYVSGTNGQYEGYNYLGLGLIIAIVIAWFIRRGVKKAERPMVIGPYLVTAMALLFAYALSNEVYASNIHLLHWDAPRFLMPVFETFRSSGRFFWPVSYLLVFFAVAYLVTLPRARVILLAVLLLPLQAADLYPTFIAIKAGLMRAPNQPADLAAWDRALAGVKTIHAFPKFKCNGALMREIMPLQVIAANGGYNLTTGFISRYGADCEAIAPEIAASDPATSAYVFTRAQFTDEQINGYIPQGAHCSQLDIWIICRKDPV